MSLRESLSLRRLNPYFSFMSLSSWLPLAMVWKSSQFPQDFPQSEVAPDEVDLFRVQNLAQKQRDRRYFTDDDKNIPGFSWKQQKLQTFRASSKPTVSSWCWPRSLDILRTFSATQRFFFCCQFWGRGHKVTIKNKGGFIPTWFRNRQNGPKWAAEGLQISKIPTERADSYLKSLETFHHAPGPGMPKAWK